MADEKKPALLLGAHVSVAGGIEKAISRGEAIGCTAIQIFTRNASRWESKPLDPGATVKFRQAFSHSSISYIAAHDSYLINLASPDESLRNRSIAAFIDEMERCHALGIKDLVMHPGAHTGAGVSQGIKTLAASFQSIFQQSPADVRVLLENTAGQGTSLGSTFEELAEIMSRLGVGSLACCVDTCHVFAAGYDLSSYNGYCKMMDEFERLIGTEHIALFHLNDSKRACGSHVDRHEHVGKGYIGRSGFKALMQDQRFRRTPKIIETPGGDQHQHDLENLALLRALAHTESEAG
ncbi:MAG: deoxyribonuclease IV [Desulfuromonadales bacterium]|nr:deoxyribonuclease IV [Desulfuromonadales bacterium]MBN2793589.1 deoxyribonuclease IV [Desulfuromonadales bacterium]